MSDEQTVTELKVAIAHLQAQVDHTKSMALLIAQAADRHREHEKTQDAIIRVLNNKIRMLVEDRAEATALLEGWMCNNQLSNRTATFLKASADRDKVLAEQTTEVASLLAPSRATPAASSKSALYCEHANEMPQRCPCPADCYCKGHSCKNRVGT